MAFKKTFSYELIRKIFLVVFALPLVATSNIDCGGKAFHCVNSTHFMICVDLGGGVSSTIDNFIIPCPPSTECQGSNHFECEFRRSTTVLPTTETSVPSELIQDSYYSVVTDSSIITANATKINEVQPTDTALNTVSITTIPEDSTTTETSVTSELIQDSNSSVVTDSSIITANGTKINKVQPTDTSLNTVSITTIPEDSTTTETSVPSELKQDSDHSVVTNGSNVTANATKINEVQPIDTALNTVSITTIPEDSTTTEPSVLSELIQDSNNSVATDSSNVTTNATKINEVQPTDTVLNTVSITTIPEDSTTTFTSVPSELIQDRNNSAVTDRSIITANATKISEVQPTQTALNTVSITTIPEDSTRTETSVPSELIQDSNHSVVTDSSVITANATKISDVQPTDTAFNTVSITTISEDSTTNETSVPSELIQDSNHSVATDSSNVTTNATKINEVQPTDTVLNTVSITTTPEDSTTTETSVPSELILDSNHSVATDSSNVTTIATKINEVQPTDTVLNTVSITTTPEGSTTTETSVPSELILDSNHSVATDSSNVTANANKISKVQPTDMALNRASITTIPEDSTTTGTIVPSELIQDSDNSVVTDSSIITVNATKISKVQPTDIALNTMSITTIPKDSTPTPGKLMTESVIVEITATADYKTIGYTLTTVPDEVTAGTNTIETYTSTPSNIGYSDTESYTQIYQKTDAPFTTDDVFNTNELTIPENIPSPYKAIPDKTVTASSDSFMTEKNTTTSNLFTSTTVDELPLVDNNYFFIENSTFGNKLLQNTTMETVDTTVVVYMDTVVTDYFTGIFTTEPKQLDNDTASGFTTQYLTEATYNKNKNVYKNFATTQQGYQAIVNTVPVTEQYSTLLETFQNTFDTEIYPDLANNAGITEMSVTDTIMRTTKDKGNVANENISIIGRTTHDTTTMNVITQKNFSPDTFAETTIITNNIIKNKDPGFMTPTEITKSSVTTTEKVSTLSQNTDFFTPDQSTTTEINNMPEDKTISMFVTTPETSTDHFISITYNGNQTNTPDIESPTKIVSLPSTDNIISKDEKISTGGFVALKSNDINNLNILKISDANTVITKPDAGATWNEDLTTMSSFDTGRNEKFIQSTEINISEYRFTEANFLDKINSTMDLKSDKDVFESVRGSTIADITTEFQETKTVSTLINTIDNTSTQNIDVSDSTRDISNTLPLTESYKFTENSSTSYNDSKANTKVNNELIFTTLANTPAENHEKYNHKSTPISTVIKIADTTVVSSYTHTPAINNLYDGTYTIEDVTEATNILEQNPGGKLSITVDESILKETKYSPASTVPDKMHTKEHFASTEYSLPLLNNLYQIEKGATEQSKILTSADSDNQNQYKIVNTVQPEGFYNQISTHTSTTEATLTSLLFPAALLAKDKIKLNTQEYFTNSTHTNSTRTSAIEYNPSNVVPEQNLNNFKTQVEPNHDIDGFKQIYTFTTEVTDAYVNSYDGLETTKTSSGSAIYTSDLHQGIFDQVFTQNTELKPSTVGTTQSTYGQKIEYLNTLPQSNKHESSRDTISGTDTESIANNINTRDATAAAATATLKHNNTKQSQEQGTKTSTTDDMTMTTVYSDTTKATLPAITDSLVEPTVLDQQLSQNIEIGTKTRNSLVGITQQIAQNAGASTNINDLLVETTVLDQQLGQITEISTKTINSLVEITQQIARNAGASTNINDLLVETTALDQQLGQTTDIRKKTRDSLVAKTQQIGQNAGASTNINDLLVETTVHVQQLGLTTEMSTKNRDSLVGTIQQIGQNAGASTHINNLLAETTVPHQQFGENTEKSMKSTDSLIGATQQIGQKAETSTTVNDSLVETTKLDQQLGQNSETSTTIGDDLVRATVHNKQLSQKEEASARNSDALIRTTELNQQLSQNKGTVAKNSNVFVDRSEHDQQLNQNAESSTKTTIKLVFDETKSSIETNSFHPNQPSRLYQNIENRVLSNIPGTIDRTAAIFSAPMTDVQNKSFVKHSMADETLQQNAAVNNTSVNLQAISGLNQSLIRPSLVLEKRSSQKTEVRETNTVNKISGTDTTIEIDKYSIDTKAAPIPNQKSILISYNKTGSSFGTSHFNYTENNNVTERTLLSSDSALSVLANDKVQLGNVAAEHKPLPYHAGNTAIHTIPEVTTTIPTESTVKYTTQSSNIDSTNILNHQKVMDPFCLTRNRGRYADRQDCTKFYICIGKTNPIVGKCPVNTVFSEIKKQCTKNKSHCVRGNEFQCISEGRFSDILRNNAYYICIRRQNSFIRFKFQCQNGHYLNKITVRCTKQLEAIPSSTSVDHSEKNVSEGTSSKESKKRKRNNKDDKKEDSSGEEFECKKEGKFADPDNCRKFYVCTKTKKSEFRMRRKSCDSDELFHKDKKKCVDADSYEC